MLPSRTEPGAFELLHDFASAASVRGWSPIDDRIMGGVSRSALEASAAGTALFRGRLSRDSGGGFASVRSAPEPRDLTGTSGIAIRFRGDGRTYSLRIRTDADLDGITYQAAFATTRGTWETARIPFAAFRATFRGRALPEASPLDLTRVTTLGLLVADGPAGDFKLETAWIAAWRG